MGTISSANVPYFMELPRLNPHHQVPVKTEASSSPDLSPASNSLQHFQFKFNPHTVPSHASIPQSRTPSESPSCLPPTPIYRFGSDSAGLPIPPDQAWPRSVASHHLPPPQTVNYSHTHLRGHQPHPPEFYRPAMSYSDEYDVSDLAELGVGDQSHGGGFGSSGSHNHEKHIRRRSSKACDQCRKSKCKCERSSPNEPCKSCIMLGTPCTFLGPSRKRGPPKGYIDAIEARLHQTEALVGIMLATKDPRARSLLEDMAKDPLAREIINRVDNSPYGVKGRKPDSGGSTKPRPAANSSSDSSTPKEGKIDLTSTHPSNEWQDNVTAMLNVAAGFEADKSEDGQGAQGSERGVEDVSGGGELRSSLRIVPPQRPTSSDTHTSDENQSPARRQRRRIGEHDFSPHGLQYPTSPNASSASLAHIGNATRRRGRSFSQTYSSLSPLHPLNQQRRCSSVDSLSSDSEDDLTGAVGQLSLNEDEQVRYHGKASGLHILHDKERVDNRNEGGIWRFPKARVWPPSADVPNALHEDAEYLSQLPDQTVQNRLLDIYFRHIHSSFPVIHKRSFLSVYEKTHSYSSEPDGSSSALNRRPRRIPTLLLLTMFAIAARYDDGASVPPPSDPTLMWSAGDEYLNAAKIILDQTYSSSRLSTCQALLLMGYREVGIGAMAQAWTYIGMAIRMAQDLGMHRGADGWARVGLGGRLFNEWELQERKRIWYGCVILDKYISTYIGRPLMIFERDFDTPLPSEDDPEELEEWTGSAASNQATPSPTYRISCFNASSTLSGVLSTIVQNIYAVRPVTSRHAESIVLEGLLDKWYLDLPEHLRYDPNTGNTKPTPLPHILTLHMQYWCAVLLLHRPFIRSNYSGRSRSEDGEDAEVVAIAAKNYELCASAANHITAIVSVYAEKYPLQRSSAFLCYYLFTACIMHVTTLTTYPSDPQANLGLKKCMGALEMMATIWPSAHRAVQLLRGAKVNLQASEFVAPSSSTVRPKRSAENSLNDSQQMARRYFPSQVNGAQVPYPPATRPEVASNYLYPTLDSYAPPHSAGHASSSHTSHAISPVSPASPAAYRWPSEDFHQPHSYQANAPLSTSVLPQVYSTGFGEERSQPPHPHHRAHSQSEPNTHNIAGRYPQYWNDYTTFPQLGQAYSGIPGTHQATPQHHPQVNPQMYAPEHYGVYGQHTFSER